MTLPLKRYLLFIPLFLGLCLAPQTPRAETFFPDFVIQTELPQEHADYLGLPDEDSFRLSDIRGDYLFITIFSLYCTPCQREAPALNEMYETIREMGLDSHIKFFGIAAGNTVREMEYWRKKFKVPFPLISDGDYVLHRSLGNIGTPAHVLARIDGPGKLHVIFFKVGAVENMQEFLDTLLANTDAGVEH